MLCLTVVWIDGGGLFSALAGCEGGKDGQPAAEIAARRRVRMGATMDLPCCRWFTGLFLLGFAPATL